MQINRENREKTRRGRWWLLPAVLLLALAAAFFLYVSDYYRAGEEAMELLQSDPAVTRTDYGWFFDGPSEDTALIFYPGGKVDEKAYAPLLHRLAENGVDVCLMKVPFHLAFSARTRREA